MISDKKLKERLIDIAAGAGMRWMDGDYFCSDDTLESVGRFIEAVEYAFSIGTNSRLRSPHRLKDYSDIDGILSLVSEAIQFDKEKQNDN